MRRRRGSPIERAVALGALWMGSAGLALATTYTWTSVSGSQWSNAANWDNGVPASSVTTALKFTNASPASLSNDIAGGLTLNSLSLQMLNSFPRTISGNLLRFDGVNPSLAMSSTVQTGTVTIGATVQANQMLSVTGGTDSAHKLVLSRLEGAGGMTLNAGFAAITSVTTGTGPISVTGGDLTMSSAASSSLAVSSGGALTLLGGWTGPLTLASGFVSGAQTTAMQARGTISGAVSLSADATISRMGNPNTGHLTFSGPLDLGLHNLTIQGGSDLLHSVSITGQISGNGELRVSGQEVRVSGAGSAFSGPIVVEYAADYMGILSIRNSNGDLGYFSNVFPNVTSITLKGGKLVSQPGSVPIFIDGSGTLLGGGGSVSGHGTLRLENGTGVGTNNFLGNMVIVGDFTLSAESSLGAITNDVFFTYSDNATSLRLTLFGTTTLSAGRNVTFLDSGNTVNASADKLIAANLTGSRIAFDASGRRISLTGSNTIANTSVLAGTTLAISSNLGGLQGGIGIYNGATLEALDNLTLGQNQLIFAADNAPAQINTNAFDVKIEAFISGDSGNGFVTKTGLGGLYLNGTHVGSVTGQNKFLGTLEIQQGILGGDGNSDGTSVNLDAGTHLAPGDTPHAIGTLTINKLLWFDGAFLDFDLGSAGTSDRLIMSSFLGTDAGTFAFNFSGTPTVGNYLLITNPTGGMPATNFEASDFTSTGLSGFNGSFQFTSQGLILTVAAVPEPATLWLLLGGGAAVGLIARRRAKNFGGK